MIRSIMKVNSKHVRWLTSVAFDSKKRFARLSLTGKVTFHTTNWFDGSLNEYVAIKLDTLEKHSLNAPAPWFNVVEGTTVNIPEGYAIVEKSIFCGKELQLTIHLNRANAITMLGDGIKAVASS